MPDRLRDETQRFLPKCGAGLSDYLLGGNPGDLSGLEFVQPPLGLLKPELLSMDIDFLIKAGDEPLRGGRAPCARVSKPWIRVRAPGLAIPEDDHERGWPCPRVAADRRGCPTDAAYPQRRALRAVGCMRLFGGLPAGVAKRSSGRNLHGRVEVDLSWCLARHHSSLAWARRANTVIPHSAEMELNGHLDAPES
jgi:hypothetical protein